METSPRSRTPSIERAIRDITEADTRVRIVGVVVRCDVGKKLALVDDGTGQIRVLTEKVLKEGMKVRVIGRVAVLKSGEIEIDGEVIQDLEGLDMELYSTIRDLKKDLQQKKVKKDD